MLNAVSILGYIAGFFSLLFVLPITCSLAFRDGQVASFALAAAVSAGVGFTIALATRRQPGALKARHGFLLVTLTWLLMSAVAALPLMFALPNLSFTDAYFESMSGLTTTGSTVMSGLDSLPPSINLWRCALHWIGGLGIVVLAVAVLPFLGVGGMALYKAETPGPVKNEKLTPRIAEMAKALWMTYLVVTAAGIVGLRIAGMSWFDAICHCFSAIGLGGFGTHDANVKFFDSPAIEMVLIAVMFLAMLNFARHFMALRTLSFDPYRRDTEAKAIAIVLGAASLLIAAVLWVEGTFASATTSLRHAAFAVVSIASTTGFVTEDYEKWAVFVPPLLLVLSSITCSTGSTGGGIKMFRTLVLLRHARRELKQLLHPRGVFPLRIAGQSVPDQIVYSVLAFMFLYFATVVCLTFALLAAGLDFVSSASAIIGSINNMGPGMGQVGPSVNFSSLTDVQTWICTLAMFLGRLEILSVIVLFTAVYWRK